MEVQLRAINDRRSNNNKLEFACCILDTDQCATSNRNIQNTEAVAFLIESKILAPQKYG
jgi:hypothetical protein